MARFRPSKLFRRLSSRSDVRTPTKSHSESQGSPSPPPSSNLSNPPHAVYSAPGSRQLRKSSSLPRLRRRSGTQGTARSVENLVESERERQESLPEVPASIQEVRESVDLLPEVLASIRSPEEEASDSRTVSVDKGSEGVDLPEQKEAGVNPEELQLELQSVKKTPIVTIEQPTPDVVAELTAVQRQGSIESRQFDSGQVTLAATTPESEPEQAGEQTPTADVLQSGSGDKVIPLATDLVRKPSIIDSANVKIVNTLLDTPIRGHERSTSDSSAPATSSGTEYFARNMPSMATMLHRKIWVKRPGASATLVQIKEDDLVDDVRDMILRKYANSLGRTFDAPDMTLHIISRAEQGANRTERMLGPEEEMCRTIDQMFPGGQTVDDALIINVPQRRTPRPSPRVYGQYHQASYHDLDEYRPLENGTDYFPPMPAVIPAATLPQTSGSDRSRSSQQQHQQVAVIPVASHAAESHLRSISVLNTGQIPPLPSPGGQSRRHQHRPRYQRQPTSSPTILSHPNAGAVAVQPSGTKTQPHIVHRQSARPRLDSSASEAPHRPNGVSIPAPPPLPSPSAPEAPPTNRDNSAPPTPSTGVAPTGLEPPGRSGRPKKPRKTTPENQNINGTIASRRKKDSSSASSPHPNPAIANLLDASVPPINVLIVEDNNINMRILESLMKRLKVRWSTATNGKIAVDKWKAGGFHLVLMDIQMPVMNGLEATKEIRRLERANSIGVFSSISPDEDERGHNGERPSSNGKEKEKADDTLPGLSEGLIKSPVIIVALTASSLQSDRHEALAAGCNDFLTKPVNFVWLERKVKEWGCMQALIDFDGWRKWKEYAAKEEAGKTEEEKAKEREKAEKERVRAEKMAKLQEKQAKAKEERERGKKRLSINSEAGGGQGPASPGLPLKREQSREEGEANGAPLEGISSLNLKTGRQMLGEITFD